MAEQKLTEVQIDESTNIIIWKHLQTGKIKSHKVSSLFLNDFKRINGKRKKELDEARQFFSDIDANYYIWGWMEGVLQVNTIDGEFGPGDILIRIEERVTAINFLVPGESETREIESPPYILSYNENNEITIVPDPPGIKVINGVIVY